MFYQAALQLFRNFNKLMQREDLSFSWPTLLLPAAVASEVAGCSAGLESLDSISSIAITLSGGLTSSVQLQLLSVDGCCSVITGDSALVSVLFLAVGERIEGCEHTGDSGDSSSVLLSGVSLSERLDMWKYFNSVSVSDSGPGFHFAIFTHRRARKCPLLLNKTFPIMRDQ